MARLPSGGSLGLVAGSGPPAYGPRASAGPRSGGVFPHGSALIPFRLRNPELRAGDCRVLAVIQAPEPLGHLNAARATGEMAYESGEERQLSQSRFWMRRK